MDNDSKSQHKNDRKRKLKKHGNFNEDRESESIQKKIKKRDEKNESKTEKALVKYQKKHIDPELMTIRQIIEDRSRGGRLSKEE